MNKKIINILSEQRIKDLQFALELAFRKETETNPYYLSYKARHKIKLLRNKK